MGGLLYDDALGSALAFLFFTVALGGLGGIATGRAFAATWRSPWVLPLALIGMAAAVRFLHYALNGEDLLSLHYYVVSLVVVSITAAYGFRSKRTEQMCRQYTWLFQGAGPVNWADRR